MKHQLEYHTLPSEGIDSTVFLPQGQVNAGDVEIAEGGFFECHGSMSGNVTNNGGEYEIHGSFSGEVYGELDDDEEEEEDEEEDDDYDIDEDN